MQFACLEQLDEIYKMLAKYRKNIFPHIRKDYVQRNILSHNVIYQDGVAIIFNVYKRKQKMGAYSAFKNDVILHQIVSNSGNAKKVLLCFFKYVKTNVWLTVRSDNVKANDFYKQNGMIDVGKISWKKGTIPGKIYYKKMSEETI
jgi:hypothetical protein